MAKFTKSPDIGIGLLAITFRLAAYGGSWSDEIQLEHQWRKCPMSPAILKRRLRETMRIWQHDQKNTDIEGLEGYMPGVLKGLKEALRIVEESQRQNLRQNCSDRKTFSRWSAVHLYRACRQAYGRLAYSDRPGAMRALKKALDQKEPKNINRV